MNPLNLQPVLRIETLSAQDFREFYLPQNRPFIIKNLEQLAPLMNWNLELLKEKLGGKKVKVFGPKFYQAGADYMMPAGTMDFTDYLATLEKGENSLRMFLYNLSSEAPELADQVPRLDLDKYFLSQVKFLFFGNSGSVTQLHYDIDLSHVFHTVIFGQKTFYLFDQSQSGNLYRHPLTVKSEVDILRPDFEKFPRLKEAQGYIAELGPGDSLFMPSGYWHHVVYQDMSAGLSLRLQHRQFRVRLKGYANLLLFSPLDRLLNKAACKQWFTFKQWRARHSFFHVFRSFLRVAK